MQKRFHEIYAHYLTPLSLWSWFVLTVYLFLWKLLVFLGVFLGRIFLPNQPNFSSYYDPLLPNVPKIWQVMSNFDGQHYLSLALKGYEPLTQAFFPLYPILISLLSRVTHLPMLLAGLIISHFSFWLSLGVVWRLFKNDLPKTAAIKRNQAYWLGLGVVVLFPTAMFYGAIYNDAVFFLLATLTIYLSRSQRWFLASISAGLATLARLNGLALWPFIIFEFLQSDLALLNTWLSPTEWWRRRWWVGKKLGDMTIWPSLLVPGAFLGYLTFQQWKFGSWQVVFGNMSVWNQEKLTFPLQVFWRYTKILIYTQPNQERYWIAFLELLFVLVYIACAIYAWKKIRFSYWLFLILSILIPALTGSFQGMPRYGLHLYPLFLVLTLFLIHRPTWQRILYFLVCGGLFLFFTAFFTRGYFVA